MLKVREYTRSEIASEIGVAENAKNLRQCITNKLERLKIGYSVNGRGVNTVFQIKEIPDRFMLYCVTEFECATNTDFQKIREVFYFALNDDNFLALPDTEKEQFLAKNGISISRGTIKAYIRKLEDADYLGGAEVIYLVVRKDSAGNHKSEIISKELYKQGWDIYWTVRAESGYIKAYDDMYYFLNGHPYKHMRPLQNAFMLEEIETLQELIRESYERDLR